MIRLPFRSETKSRLFLSFFFFFPRIPITLDSFLSLSLSLSLLALVSRAFSQEESQADLHKLAAHTHTRAHLRKSSNIRYVTRNGKEQRRWSVVNVINPLVSVYKKAVKKHTQESRIRRGCLYLFRTIQCAREVARVPPRYTITSSVPSYFIFFFFLSFFKTDTARVHR